MRLRGVEGRRVRDHAVRLHPANPHYFEFRGKAVALVTSGEHYGSVLNGAFDYRRYLAVLAGDGLNYTRIFGGSYIEIPGRSFGIQRNNLAPETGKFIAPWAKAGEKFDLDKWNPGFFDRRIPDPDASARGNSRSRRFQCLSSDGRAFSPLRLSCPSR